MGTVSAGVGAVNIMGLNLFKQVRDYIPDFEPQGSNRTTGSVHLQH